jgi:ankyrin repeat protein
MNTKARLYTVYFIAFLVTLSGSMVLTFARYSAYVSPQSVFVSAAWSGRLRIMRVAEMLGAEVDKPACENRHCLLPLVTAAWGGNEEAVEFLLDRGANLNDGGRLEVTPLMFASYCGHTKIVKLLLDRGADVNMTDSMGNTALSFARQKNQRRVISLLLQAGARD